MQEKQLPDYLAVERAIDELRRQMGIVVREDNGHAIANFPVEFLEEQLFSQLQNPSLKLLITDAYAQSLGLGNKALKINAHNLKFAYVMALCNPLERRKSVESLAYSEASEVDSMVLQLAKYAGLLPALLVTAPSDSTGGWLTISATDLTRYIQEPLIEVIEGTHAALPIDGAEQASIISFRSRHSTAVHLALVIGDISAAKNPRGILTRVHSSCVTGDILGSMRCDCGDQLHVSIEELKASGNGVLLYLHQEGRGIGITNKLRAYALQEQGVDTYDANLRLGFDEDERDFSIAAAILKKLGISRIRLLSNNPYKINALENHGIAIAERVPLVIKTGKHNHAYLDAKAKKSGHLF